MVGSIRDIFLASFFLTTHSHLVGSRLRIKVEQVPGLAFRNLCKLDPKASPVSYRLCGVWFSGFVFSLRILLS